MIKQFLLASLLLFAATADAQDFNLEFVANVTYESDGNDIWGFVDKNGTEYAVVGSQASTLLYDLTIPSDPQLVYEVAGAFGTWRDMKSIGDYIYVTADQGSDGLLVIDMSAVGDSITHNFWRPMYDKGSGMQQLSRVHNIYADDRYVYLSGLDSDNQRGGVLILDTETDAKEPPVVGIANQAYSHDVYVQDTLMYTSEIYLGVFGVYSIADPSNPRLLARAETTSDFTHNAWLSADGNYLFTTDEVQDANVDAYDLSDLSNIRRLDAFQPYRPGAEAPTIPHNTHYHNGFLVTSWYEDGVVIIDANKPDNLVEVASYDTWLSASGTGRGFNGCWGVSPYLPSGLVIANDINSGLYILDPTYVRASYLEGIVLDSLTRLPIPGASISIQGAQAHRDIADQSGEFKTGIAETGSFEVIVRGAGYDTKVVTLDLSSGDVTEVEIELTKSIKTGTVQIASDGQGLEGAAVVFIDQETGISIQTTTDNSGAFAAQIDRTATYNVYAGKWGYTGVELTDVSFDGGASITLEVNEGYEDDFFADLGWTIGGDAATGAWEIGAPLGTVDDNTGLTSNPDTDASDDLGNQAYVTGNQGVGLGDDDVDSGITTLQSPAMLFGGEEIDTIDIELAYWYYTCCGTPPTNDSLEITLSNGTEEVVLQKSGQITEEWTTASFVITRDMIAFTDDMTVMVTATDNDPGHIVEAGVDRFRASARVAVISNLEEVILSDLAVMPNPFDHTLRVRHPDLDQGSLMIYNVNGQLIHTARIDEVETRISTSEWLSGIYFARILSGSTISQTIRIVKQ